MSASADLLDAALDYAARGWAVFPLEVGGKRPLGRLAQHGLKDASTDFDIVTRWWTAEPRANLGLLTGVHFDVLDIDGPEALDAFENAGPLGAPDCEGPTVCTPRGWHAYVAPTGKGNAVNVGSLAGIDWRGVGGYVVAPPSLKADGTCWEWTTGSPFDLGPDTPIMPAPGWVLALFDRRDVVDSCAEEGPPRHAGKTAYSARALESELGRLAVASPGSRNDALNRSAHALGQLVGGGALDLAEVASSLVRVALRVGLPETEARRTIASGLKAGLLSPRRVAS